MISNDNIVWDLSKFIERVYHTHDMKRSDVEMVPLRVSVSIRARLYRLTMNPYAKLDAAPMQSTLNTCFGCVSVIVDPTYDDNQYSFNGMTPLDLDFEETFWDKK